MASQARRNIPERLKQNNRPAIQQFDPQERLFHRFNKLTQEGGHFYPASIGFPEFSVNRERFSEPEDVLLPDFFNWGIAAFKKEDIPGAFVIGNENSNETVYDFIVFHVPEEENYSHSEVRTLVNGVYSKKKRIRNKDVKRYFRFKLSERLKTVRDPLI